MFDNKGPKNPMWGKKHSNETKALISRKAKGRNTGAKNPMYGKKHSNKEKFRKYNGHPAIDYEDFIVDNNGSKKFLMKCLTCLKVKGHRNLGSLNLPCFTCAMSKTLKYTPIQRRIREAAKARINSRFRRNRLGKPVGIHFKDLPFTLIELMDHLQNLFRNGMSWQNYGEWHIDHIRPESSFDYQSAHDPQFVECWSLKNLQPLWKLENLKKGAKYA